MTAEPIIRQRRQRRKVLTDAMIVTLERRSAAYFRPDPELPKHGVRVQPKGPPHAFYVIARDPYKRQRWVKIGSTAEMEIAAARAKARGVIERIEQGPEPFPPPPVEPTSVAAVVENWLTEHVERHRLRSGAELKRICTRYLLPAWGKLRFAEIGRQTIRDLLKHIASEHGPSMADATLSVVRQLVRFQQEEDKDYRAPTLTNLRRVPAAKRQRQRTLTDDELRRVWCAAGAAGPFGALVKLLLVTAQRRDKLLTLRFDDIRPDNVWVIRTEPGEKRNAGAVRLPEVALEIIRSQSRFVGSPFVFAGSRGAKAFSFSRLKADFDAKCGVAGWRLHDLRRTSRTLMSRAKVNYDFAEMVMGHSLGRIRETYDTFDYLEEKSHVVHEVAALIERIVNQPEGNVAVLHDAAAAS